jgi:hypothetical protein
VGKEIDYALFLPCYIPACRAVNSAYQIEDSRFSGAVGADQAQDLAFGDVEVNVLDRAQSTEKLCEFPDCQQPQLFSTPFNF